MDSGVRIGIIGAGAWGLSAALALAEAGAHRVQVFDRARAGSGSTALAAGLVSTHLRQQSDIGLVLQTRERIRALQAWGRDEGRPSADHAYKADGSITLAREEDADRLGELRERVRGVGGQAELMRPHEIQQRWPLRDCEGLVGLYTEEDGHVEAGDLVDLMEGRLRTLGVRVASERAAGIHVDGGSVVAIETTGGKESFDMVLLAAGSWSKSVARQAGLSLPVKAYRTQLAQLEYAHARRFPIVHDTSLHVYARPDGDQAILVGDGTELFESQPESFNRAVDHSFVEKVAASAGRRLVDGEAAGFRRGWAGLCVATPDRDPLIGPYPGVDGLHLMVGDNGFGVMRSLALGQVAADRVLGRRDSNPRLYQPKRFAMSQEFPIREGFEL